MNFSLQMPTGYGKINRERRFCEMNEEKKIENDYYQKQLQRSKQMRRRVCMILFGAIGVFLLLFGAAFVIERIGKSSEREIPEGGSEFYPTYEGDIMENEEYLGLNRQVSYCSDPSGYGLTTSITEENREDFDDCVLFLYDYLQTIIAGDHEAYNRFFNQTFFEDNESKSAFSQQMLHNIKISFISEVQEGQQWIKVYRMEYMIHRNDGSFRRDVESDAIRPQEITLRVGADGTPLIEKIVTLYTKQ